MVIWEYRIGGKEKLVGKWMVDWAGGMTVRWKLISKQLKKDSDDLITRFGTIGRGRGWRLGESVRLCLTRGRRMKRLHAKGLQNNIERRRSDMLRRITKIILQDTYRVESRFDVWL